jgi:superfamily II DNA or RNA helicase
VQELPSWSGQRVDVRGETWRVAGSERFDGTTLVTLVGAGRANLGETTRLLLPFDRLRARVSAGGPRPRRRRAVLRAAATTLAESQEWTDCWAAAAAKIDVRGWQLEPARAAVSGATRILLADAVGLGKTIQALLVVGELHARGLVERALILTPAALREQWADEMRTRFGLAATVLDHAALAAATRTLPPGINPWHAWPFVVASLDLAKRAEVRAALDGTVLDALVVDEAHHLAPWTDRGALVAALASRAHWVVLATATPHSGNEAAFRFLTTIGDVGSGDELRIFRRTAAHVRRHAARRTTALAIRPTPAEQALFDGVLDYARTLWRHGAGTPDTRLLATVIARRAASSPAAARLTLERRLALLTAAEPAQLAEQGALPWDEPASDDDVVHDAVLMAPGLTDRGRESDWLRRLSTLASGAAESSSKLGALARLLRRTAESAIVFSEYRDVVEQVASRFSGVTSVATLHGALSATARRAAIARFTTGQARLLVATDAAGEGLNLHARCRLVVTLELPWNPQRLEQRVGRVDRIGQTRRVHALHLIHRGSVEDEVLARLEVRQRRAAEALIGESLVGQDDIAAAILEGAALPEHKSTAPLPTPSAPSLDAAAAVRVRRLRALARCAYGQTAADGPVFASERRRRLSKAVIAVFSAAVLDASGRLVQRMTVPLRVRVAGHLPRRLTREWVESLAGHAAIEARVQQEISAQLDVLRAAIAPCSVAASLRAQAIVSCVTRRETDRLLQSSLFDKRAERSALELDEVRDRWLAHVRRRQQKTQALASLTAAPARLVAAWLAD